MNLISTKELCVILNTNPNAFYMRWSRTASHIEPQKVVGRNKMWSDRQVREFKKLWEKN
jgi:hypothetical protein